MKRIVTKIGDIFCVDIGDNRKRYFQYIANDIHQLNSSTIRVFTHNYTYDDTPNMEDITTDNVEFYTHTVLKSGIQNGLWEKVGKSKDVGSFDSILFRSYNDVPDSIQSLSWYTGKEGWYIWHLGEEDSLYIGKQLGDYSSISEYGSVFPPSWVVDRIKYGKWLCKLPQ